MSILNFNIVGYSERFDISVAILIYVFCCRKSSACSLILSVGYSIAMDSILYL